MGYNYSKLKGKISEVFGSQKSFANAIGLSERTISLKINNKISFTQTEITKSMKALGLDESEVQQYFFALETQNS